jgi:hypothetical protein
VFSRNINYGYDYCAPYFFTGYMQIVTACFLLSYLSLHRVFTEYVQVATQDYPPYYLPTEPCLHGMYKWLLGKRERKVADKHRVLTECIQISTLKSLREVIGRPPCSHGIYASCYQLCKPSATAIMSMFSRNTYKLLQRKWCYSSVKQDRAFTGYIRVVTEKEEKEMANVRRVLTEYVQVSMLH